MRVISKLKNFSLLVIAYFCITGFGNSVPECSDGVALNLIVDVIYKKFELGEIKGVEKKQLKLSSVETISKDDRLGKRSCQARLDWKLSPEVLKFISSLDNPESMSPAERVSFLSGFIISNPSVFPEVAIELIKIQYGKDKGDIDKLKLEVIYKAALKTEIDGQSPGKLRLLSKVFIDKINFPSGIIFFENPVIKYRLRTGEGRERSFFFAEVSDYDEESLSWVPAIEGLSLLFSEGSKIFNEFKDSEKIKNDLKELSERDRQEYIKKISALIISNTIFDDSIKSIEKPSKFLIRLTGDCQIESVTMTQSSGQEDWDQAARSGILKTKGLPKRADNTCPQTIEISRLPMSRGYVEGAISKNKMLVELEAKCAKGDVRECVWLGYAFAVGATRDKAIVKVDEKKAMELFEKSCSKNDPLGCMFIGDGFSSGKWGYSKDNIKAANYWERACRDAEAVTSCANLGKLYLDGNDIPRDFDKASNALRLACDRASRKAKDNSLKEEVRSRWVKIANDNCALMEDSQSKFKASQDSLAKKTAPAKVEDTSPFSPSFDCQKASSGPERLICSDRELSKLDVELSQSYMKARDKAEDKKTLRSQQLAWMKSRRNACSDKACMAQAYKDRIAQLN